MLTPEQKDADTDLVFVRELVKRGVWSILYHEQCLLKAHRLVGVVKQVVERGFPEIDTSTITGNDDDDYVDQENAETAAEYVAACMHDALSGVTHHEEYLRKAHHELACAKMIVARGNYPGIDIKAISEEQAKRLAEKD